MFWNLIREYLIKIKKYSTIILFVSIVIKGLERKNEKDKL